MVRRFEQCSRLSEKAFDFYCKMDSLNVYEHDGKFFVEGYFNSIIEFDSLEELNNCFEELCDICNENNFHDFFEFDEIITEENK